MLSHSLNLLIAYLVDRLVGDPRAIPHPVVLIGNCISILEKMIRRIFKQEKVLKFAGILFPIFIVGGTFLVTKLVIYSIGSINYWLGLCLEIWLISTTIATKGLADAAMEVYRHLHKRDLDKARYSLGMIVGRDTQNLDESEISRGTVETVAENIVDAVLSPFFYALIGGAPLAMAYRAANTLDSMVGYKNKKYQNLGWASARLDDILNYIPARLTALFILLAGYISKFNVTRAWYIIKRDAKKHPSPNSGIPEAAVAGGLGIQLGGTNFYDGVPSVRAKMGENDRVIEAVDILRTISILHKTSLFGLLILSGFAWIIFYFLS